MLWRARAASNVVRAVIFGSGRCAESQFWSRVGRARRVRDSAAYRLMFLLRVHLSRSEQALSQKGP